MSGAIRSAANAGSTIRDGACTCWVRASARSVGSVAAANTTPDKAMASSRNDTVAAACAVPVVTCTGPASSSGGVPSGSLKSRFTVTSARTVTSSGQARRAVASGRSPSRGKAISQPSTTTPDVTGSEARKTPTVTTTAVASLTRGLILRGRRSGCRDRRGLQAHGPPSVRLPPDMVSARSASTCRRSRS